MRRAGGAIAVSVPDDQAAPEAQGASPGAGESIQVQALAYDAVREIAELRHLEHLSDSLLEE